MAAYPQIITILSETTSPLVTIVDAPWVSVTSVNGMTGDVSVEPMIFGFQAYHYYLQDTVILHNGALCFAKQTFTSGTLFDADDWTTSDFTQVQANWTEPDDSSKSYILNKPLIPTQLTDLTNDGFFIQDEDYAEHISRIITDEERNKLTAIEDNATANATNAQLRDRVTHTGVQAINTITNLQTELDTKATNVALNTHTSNTSNPHSVTKAQVGLSNVTNDQQVTITGTQTITGNKTFTGVADYGQADFTPAPQLRLYANAIAGSITTTSAGSYTKHALSTPCTVTSPVISGRKYIVTTSTTYLTGPDGEVDFGAAIGTTPLVGQATYGAVTIYPKGIPVSTSILYTASSTGNITFQCIVASGNAGTIRIDNPTITVQRVWA